jgi:TRAP-type C4-dicarboxylate transport system permease small subunit
MAKEVIQGIYVNETDRPAQREEGRTDVKVMGKGPTLQEVYVSTPLLRVDAFLRRLCRIFATAGGIILTALTLLTVGTVLGRAFLNTPIPGDFEMVELGAAIAISFFLPYCQIQEGNVMVDIVTTKAPMWAKRLLGALGDLLLLAISALISWRLYLGCLQYREYGDVTMILQIPIWWGMLPVIASFTLLAITCASTMLNNLVSAFESEGTK